MIYTITVPMKCLEISFSVVENQEAKDPGSKYDIVVIILNSELRIYAVTNDPEFKFQNKILEIHANVDLYDKEYVGHASGLKIDLVPRLSKDQVIYLVTYYEQTNNMLLYSYKRQVLQFDF